MNIKQFLDSTYLKTPFQANISDNENLLVVEAYIKEAIDENFKLIMIRPNMVTLAKKMILNANSRVAIGTVISFPDGNHSLDEKYAEAIQTINDGADDLDIVCNYVAFKNGEINLVKNEILQLTKLGIQNNKTVKWIIEVAALNDTQIIQICALIKNTIIANFKEESFNSVFIKSSTGFFQTENGLPNGATIHSILLMLENGSPLPIKAAGGIKTYAEAIEMINLGVKRIGTSSAKAIAENTVSTKEY